jgi:hypothetical protein
MEGDSATSDRSGGAFTNGMWRNDTSSDFRPSPPEHLERELVDASAHLGDSPRLGAMLQEDGYLYFRGVIDPALIAHARGLMIEALVEQGLLPAAAAEKHAEGEIFTEWTHHRIPGVGLPGKQVQTAFQNRRIWEDFVEIPSVRRVFEQIAGGPVNFLPLSEYRSAPPGWTTPMHQDGYANYGYELCTAWFPLMPIDEELGGLAVLGRSPERPYPPLTPNAQIRGTLAAEPNWRRANYLPGDMVVFAGATMHCGMANRTADRLRLSMELRFQGPLAPRPAIGRIIRISPDALTIAGDEGGEATFAIDEATFLRGDRFYNAKLLSRSEIEGSELAPGFHVIVAHRDGVAVSVRGVF